MKQVRNVLALALAGAVAAGAVGIQPVYAQDKKEYVPQNVQRVMLKEGPLHGADGKMIHIERIAFPPGWVGGKHYHAGPVFVYVLKGNRQGSPKLKARLKFC
jgi:quercetin dioxygenase-like cupin family protein